MVMSCPALCVSTLPEQCHLRLESIFIAFKDISQSSQTWWTGVTIWDFCSLKTNHHQPLCHASKWSWTQGLLFDCSLMTGHGWLARSGIPHVATNEM